MEDYSSENDFNRFSNAYIDDMVENEKENNVIMLREKAISELVDKIGDATEIPMGFIGYSRTAEQVQLDIVIQPRVEIESINVSLSNIQFG